MEAYYREQLEQASRYEDLVMEQLYKIGIPLLIYKSRGKQYGAGESMNGIEVKNDKRMHETGNVYIEIAEKSNASNEEYVPSGIYRKDNTWLWAIGDERTIYLMSKKQLQWAYEHKKHREVRTETSIGMLIPVADVEKFYSIKTIEIGANNG